VTRIPGPRTPRQFLDVVRQFQRSLPQGLGHLLRTYGEISAFGAGPTRTYFLFGPDANALVLSDPDTFRFAGAYDMLEPIAGPTALVVTDGPGHDRRRRASAPSFHRAGADHCTQLIVEHVDRLIDTWSPGERVDVYQALREAVRAAMVRAFCGEVLAEQTDFLASELDNIHALMDYPLPKQLVAWRLPTPARRRALAGIAAVEKRIFAEISRKRRTGDVDGPDLISVMLRARGNGAGAMTDREIRDMVVSALIAGYDPVSSGLGWAVFNLLTHPDVLDEVRGEVDAGLDGAAPGSADIRRLPLLQRVVNESLRLYPPVVMSPRRCTRPVQFRGHTIPAGSLVAISEYLTHRWEGVWEDPNEFRPQRWDRDREDHRAPSPFEYLPFGYGSRRCVGAGISGAAIPAVLARLMQRVHLDLLTPDPQFAGIPALYPKEGLLVRVRGAAGGSRSSAALEAVS
jgi:cytochrome P450